MPLTIEQCDARILALNEMIDSLDEETNQSDLGRSLDFDSRVARLQKRIEYYEAKRLELEGPIDDSIQGIT